MNEMHLQNIVTKLEDEILGFMEQYQGTQGYLQGMIGGSIQDRYQTYAQFINIGAQNDVTLLLPKYRTIETFMEQEFDINYIREKEDPTNCCGPTRLGL